ncbi:MAG: YdiU family protein [Candidatus Dadabacteria bacterium]|nr:MAG: YdiU family protein [Candidatus Dadabacteria bacterium]
MRKLTELLFDNTYRRLPGDFYDLAQPTPFSNPRLVAFNPDAARLMGLDPDEASNPDFVEYFSGRKLLPGSEPIAMYYTGHQFGVYNPDIGDGRAILLGEVSNGEGRKLDLHLKGAGRTKYARVFDGRAVLRSVIREYLAGEAIHGLGIPTTRALTIVGSDETVERETLEQGAMMLRLAESHVRFGSFEAFCYSGRPEYVELLADYVIERHFPRLANADDKYGEFLAEVTDRTASLIALWQAHGFTHGVMNTDNMSILGLTIDYGPYGFMEGYDPEYVPNYSDHFGRYSYSNQPAIALWNLRKLALSLSPVVSQEKSAEIVSGFRTSYGKYYTDIMRRKLGLMKSLPDDTALIRKLLDILAEQKTDYTNFFRRLGGFSTDSLSESNRLSPAFDEWSHAYGERLRLENSIDSERKAGMDSVNPKYVLRNYIAEGAIRKAVDENDYSEIERVRLLLKEPFSEQSGSESYAEPAPDWARGLVVSCSS